jgi:tRNA 2-thiouridine synthesizing protein A
MPDSEATTWKLPPGWSADTYFDGGDTGCGILVMNLRQHFLGLDAGVSVAVRATDLGAPLDLPAWCRATGNELIAAEHPLYLMRVKERPTTPD